MIQADALKLLEDRISKYVEDVPELIAMMLYRQLNRGRKLTMDEIDHRIERVLKKSEIAMNCNCNGKHPTSVPFAHWIAGDAA